MRSETGENVDNSYRDDLNAFLVRVFNDILKTEEKSVTDGEFGDLSLKEIHVIEAVCDAHADDNSAGAIAARLRITAGSLSTAVAPLERKGYIERKADDKDRRVTRLTATQAGLRANEKHGEFHREMISGVLRALPEDEIAVLVKALSGISDFFAGKNKQKTGDS